MRPAAVLVGARAALLGSSSLLGSTALLGPTTLGPTPLLRGLAPLVRLC